MLGSATAFSGFSTNDLDAARAFYGDTLGLTTELNAMGILELHFAHGGRVIVYPKPDHQPAAFTVLNFEVDDIDAAAAALTAAGVALLRYDGLGQDAAGISRGRASGRGPDIAWFTDPAGNILSVLQN